MATQNNTQKKNSNSAGNRKNTNGSGNRKPANRRGSTAKGSSGKAAAGKKDGSGSDKWVNIFLVLLLITIVVLAVMYFGKGADESGEPTPPPTQQASPGGVMAGTPTVTGGEGMLTPSVSPTEVSKPTPSPAGIQPDAEPTEPPTPTVTPSPSPMATPMPTVPVSEGIGTVEADEILADVFWENGYRFTLSDSKFVLDGGTYYRYAASYNGEAQDYDVLVCREDGNLYYYEDGIRREFDGLPEHTKQPGEEGGDVMTAEAAAKLLKQFSYTSLGLFAELDECSLVLDNWKTVVRGEECFCLNVFYNGALAGSIYFTEAAEHVYYLDEFGEFVGVR